MIDRRIKRSKKILKDTFIRLLNEKSFDMITIKELVAEADVNRSTFYDHYENKEHLLIEIMETILEEMERALLLPVKNGETNINFEDKDPSVVTVLKYVDYNKFYLQALINSNLADDFNKRLYDLLIKHSRENIEFHFKNNVQINKHIYSHYAMSSLLGIINAWLKNEITCTLEELSEEIYKINTYTPYKVSTKKTLSTMEEPL
ncbi:TetR/AcrR family transcriptional regulator [Solibacillus sp. FSL R5-0449]|uniref:TetR/AcrR family transcriptional regulator n=1 Tax=Solibacillus sp. FSL R5-0449 TaxID=2921639 RepID=UPI0030D1AF8B